VRDALRTESPGAPDIAEELEALMDSNEAEGSLDVQPEACSGKHLVLSFFKDIPPRRSQDIVLMRCDIILSFDVCSDGATCSELTCSITQKGKHTFLSLMAVCAPSLDASP
jgi:hypothetical protein